MTSRRRCLQVALVAALVGGCASAPSASPTAAVPRTASPTTLPSASSPVASPVASPTTSAPEPSSAASPSSDVATPAPTTPGDPTTIAWRRLGADDPLTAIRSITRWRGGYVARGDPATVDGGEPGNGDAPVHTRLWTSTDGSTWDPLGADAMDPAAVVVGMAATSDGIVALTGSSGDAIRYDEPPTLMLKLTGPLRTWVSTDGRSWTERPGPGSDLPPDTLWQSGERWDLLHASAGTVLFAEPGTGRLLVSPDGLSWETARDERSPAGSEVKVSTTGFALLDIMSAVVTSPDGRTWTRHALPAACPGNGHLEVARSGMIVTGELDSSTGVFPSVWCSSLDGRRWKTLPGLPPLGVMHHAADQECRDACPDGSLVSDGDRMLAYRGWGEQAGWTSFDGRTWTSLTFEGHPEASRGWLDDQCTQNFELLPVGVRCTASDGTTWFGDLRS